MRSKQKAYMPRNLQLEFPAQAQKKKAVTKRKEDPNNEEISVSGSTSSSSSVHSVFLNSRMENKKQPFDSDISCKCKKQKETLSLFPETVIPNMKKEPVKRENEYKKEINGSTDSFVRCVRDSRMATTNKAKKEKEVSVSDEVGMSMKRKTPEAEEERQISVDLALSLGYQSKNKKQRTAEISLPRRADSKVSTKLMLYDNTWPTENRRHYAKELSEAEKKVACKIAAMKNYSPEEEEEEKRKGVSTKLELYCDPWIFKKKLTLSDFGHLSRLLLRTSFVKKQVFPLMDADSVNAVGTIEGLDVTVCDQDTNSLHHLVFKQWRTSKCYVLNGSWVHDFVKRRKLNKGDEIGMYWDPNFSRFNFCVLNRASTIQPAATASNGTSSSGRN